MTKADFENQHVNMINQLIDLTNEATEAWKYHPENPNQIDAVQYHDVLVNQIQQLEVKIANFVAEHENV
jgi:hypothetical protein